MRNIILNFSSKLRSCQVLIVLQINSRYRLLNSDRLDGAFFFHLGDSFSLAVVYKGLLFDKVTLTSFVSVQLLYVQIFTLEGSQHLL